MVDRRTRIAGSAAGGALALGGWYATSRVHVAASRRDISGRGLPMRSR